jgi:hypothetical protein
LRLLSVCLGFALALTVPVGASASDKSLKAALAKWSHQIQLDAQGVQLSATRHHPQRMSTKARRFRAAALQARRAVLAQKATTARGRRARTLALQAFRNYAEVGREWRLSGEARARRDLSVAAKHARLASDLAKKGNSLLVGAARLLR